LAQRTGTSVIGLTSPANIECLLKDRIFTMACMEEQEERVRSSAGDRLIAIFMDTAGNGSVDLDWRLASLRNKSTPWWTSKPPKHKHMV